MLNDDLSMTLNRIQKIRKVFMKNPEGIWLKKLSQITKIPESSIKYTISNYFFGRIKINKQGRKKIMRLINYSLSKKELELITRQKMLGLAKNLRKKGYSYSEIHDMIRKKGYYITSSRLSKILRNVKINEIGLARYKEKIRKDKIKAGSISGKLNVESGYLTRIRREAVKKLRQKALSKIPGSSKKLTIDKIKIIGHCLFDGSVSKTKNKWYAVQYTNKSKVLINKFKENMEKVYKLRPSSLLKYNGLYNIRYFSLAVVLDILKYIKNGISQEIFLCPNKWKTEFLKTFWDDEGMVGFGNHRDAKNYLHINRYVEAYCDNNKIRKQLIKLHEDVGFEIKEYNKRIRISGFENLKRFAKSINFSSGVFVSYPKSKFNGIEKRKILKKMIASYKKKC